MTFWEPHPEACDCLSCNLDARATYADVWAGNPDTDKAWAKEQRTT